MTIVHVGKPSFPFPRDNSSIIMPKYGGFYISDGLWTRWSCGDTRLRWDEMRWFIDGRLVDSLLVSLVQAAKPERFLDEPSFFFGGSFQEILSWNENPEKSYCIKDLLSCLFEQSVGEVISRDVIYSRLASHDIDFPFLHCADFRTSICYCLLTYSPEYLV
jgi:hypothetical protein